MKVALDATPLREPTGGIRRYTEELAAALAREFPQDAVILVSDQAYQQPEIPGVMALRVVSRRWWSYGVWRWMAAHGVELFHGTDFAVPYLPVRPSVMTLHDLSPWREDCGAAATRRVRVRTPWLLRFGIPSLVITPSEAVRWEAVSRFRLSPEEVEAIPLAANERFRPLAPESSGPRYFLYAGTIEPRKNLQAAIHAWRPLKEQVEFWVAGRILAHCEILPEPGLRLLGAVPDTDLPRLYAGALAVVYPSLYEGFGLPVLEAMQCGAVVLTSQDAAITETAGGACLHVAPDGWPAALRAVLADAALRSTYRKKALERAGAFSWRQTARRTRAAYSKALRRFHG